MISDEALKAASILIVDDQALNIALLTELLTKHGYTDLRSTTDARQVTALYGERPPDLILLDLVMPQLSGFEVMEQLRPLIPPDDYLPILVLTADTTFETKQRALSGGAKDFLAKPFSFEEVALRVGNLLETRLLQRQLREQNALLEEQVCARTAQVLEREARQRAILDALPDLLFVQDADGVFIDYHAPDDELLFVPVERFLGKPATEVFPADLAATLEAARRAAHETHQVQSVEYTLPMATGTMYFDARFSPADNGQTVTMARDVTQRRRADRFMTALNEAALNMGRALTRDDAFSILRQELGKMGIECMMLMCSEDGDAPGLQYANIPAKALALAEKLAGIRREDYRLVIADSDLYRQVVREREVCFIPDVTKALEPLLPRKARRFAGAIAKALGISRLIVVPVTVSGRVIAMLLVQSEELTEGDVPAVSAFAHQVAAAWRKTELYEEALQEISERKAAEERVRSQLSRVAALRTIDSSISSKAGLGRTLEVVLKQVVEQLEVDAASLLSLDPDTETLSYLAGHGFRGRAIEKTSLRMGEGSAGRAALERRFVRVPNMAKSGRDFTRAEMLAAEGFVAYHAVPLIVKDDVVGVLEVFNRGPRGGSEGWWTFLQTIAGQAAIAVENARLLEGLQRAHAGLVLAYDSTIEGWAHALDLRDRETEGHSRRVTEMTERLARAMGVGEDEIVHIRRGALLHDIGKVGVPDGILLKPGPLTEDEWVVMRRHPRAALDLLSPIDYLTPALDIPHCHHERWDGTGYPSALIGEEIPLAARLFAVVDVWDALRSDRPYRRRWSKEQAIDHIGAGAGTHFDPKVVEVFLRMVSGEIERPQPGMAASDAA